MDVKNILAGAKALKKKQEVTATDKIRADRALDSGSEEFSVGAELDRYVGKASALAPYSPAPTTAEQPTYVEQTPLERKEQKLVSAARQRAEKRKTAGDDYYKKEYGMTKAEYDKEYDAIDRMSAVREARSDMQEIEDTAKARTEEKVALAPLVKEYKDAFIGILPESAYAWHSPVGDKEEIKEDIVLDYLMTLPAEERYAQLEKAAYRSTIVPRIEALKEKATQFMNEESERITAMQKHVPVPSYSAAAGMQLGAGGTWESPVEYLEDLYTSVKKDDFKSGFVEAADWRDFISFGLASLGGDAAKLQALQKAHKGEPLTEQDEFFIEVAEIEQALEDFRKEKGGASFWNSLGSGAAHSTQFLTEMLMTGGLGGAAKVATSGIKQAFKQGVGRGLAHLAIKNVPKTLVYGAKRSPLMAGTYRNLMDRRINQYSVANGQVDLTNPESLWKSIGVAWADQTFEIASELWGNMLHLGFGKIGKAIGADKWLKTKSVNLKTTPAMRRIFRDGLLWSGDIPSEMTSEFLGDVATNLAYSAFNKDEQYWGELFTRDYWGNLLALTAGLKAGVTVASIPSIVDANKKMKQLEARSAEAFNAIGNEELKNKVLNLGGRTDIEDVAEYMHSIEWSQYKPIEVAHAIDYMMSEVERQVVAGSEAEQERAERYAPRLKRIQELAYLNAEGVAMPTMVTADVNFGADDTKSVTIIQGDYTNPEAMVWVRLADGTTKAVVGEKISNVQETDMASLVAEDYAMTFAEEDAMETLGEMEQTLFDMQRTGASNTQQIRAVEKAGLTVFNEGEVVTLLNGEEATVVEGFRHGLYTVMRADGSLSMVGVGGILQPDVAIAQAQRNAAMPQEQTPLTQSAPLPEGIDTTTDYATPDGFVGKAVDYNAESDQVTLQSADGGLTNVPRASLTTANAEQVAPQEDITENLATETISEMEQGEAEEAPMPVAPQTAPIPQNEDGSVDYESMTDATMYANALESDMGNVADAQEAVVDVRQSKEAELAKLQEQKKHTANMNEKVALRQQEQRLVQQIAMLNEVENILGSRATAVDAETAQVNEAVETAPIAETTTEPMRAIAEGVKENDFATQLRNENPAEYNTFNALAKLLGLEIEFVESAGEGNALIVGNKMQVAYNPANREETLRFLIGHESLHRLKQVAPEAYAELMEDVKSYIGEELFGQRVERLRVRYEHQGIAITEESLYEEVVADFIGEMEEDYNVVSDLVTNNPNKSWWQKLIEGLRNLFAFLEVAEADTAKVASILNKIETAYKAAAEKVQTLEVETANGEVSAEINEAEGQAKLSIRTYEEGGRATLVDFLQKQQAKDALTAEEADDILAQMDNLYTICKDYKDKYAPFGQWSDASVVVGEDGKPVFSVIKKNGEYAMNLDFSLVCKKRRTLDAVLNEMVKRGLIEGISVSETTIAKINEVIRRYGFETACALCFVDARRFRVLKVAKDFADLYNSVVDKLIPKGSNIAVNEFNYGGREDVVEKENALDTMADESLNISALQKMSEGKSVKARIARHLLDNPQDRKYVTPSDFVSTAGFDNVAANNVPLLKLYNAKKGTGGPKAAFSDVQYLNDIAKKNWSVEDAFAVGGVRIQSFSDFVPRMVFDYMQMVAELAGKKLPAHAYTKEAIFAKMFGLTGIKINLSLVPDVVEGGVAAGLDANGDYVWRDGETFPYEEAVALQNAEGYKENCGTIAVGVSDEHILKMLDDPHIRMVIPYHKSGLNPLVAKMNNIGAYKDYTKEQSTRTAKGNSRTKEQKAQLPEPSFNELLRESNSPMEAAQKYLDWCKEHNLKPKFDRFASHPNYYKLLEDFTTYVDGAYVPQRSVTMTYPTAENAFGSISELIAQGLEEDAILEGQRDAKVSQMVDEIEGAKFSLRNPKWQSQFGVPLADGKELSLEDVRTLFEKTNKRKVLQQMFDKVYEVMEKLPYYGIIVTSQMPEGSEDSLGVADGKGNILLNVRMFQEISNKGIATTILHEMIHSATIYATIAYEERNENPEAYKALPENIKTACQRLQNIYDFLLKRNNLKEEYGMTSIHEMLAELSNPQFRALLREEGVWEKLVNALKRFFGIGTGKTVKELDETLKTFLENFDRSAYVETVEAIAGEKVFERKVDAKEADNQGKDVKYSVKDLTEEEQNIIATAKANGTYLKAPNGADTNLTPEQWVRVRTKAFKKWFGDWEKAARIEKLHNSKSISISGNEIAITDDFKLNKSNAIEYGKTLTGSYVNKDTGKEVRLTSSKKNGGLYEILQHNYKDVEHIQSIAAIPKIIEESIYIDTIPNEDTSKHPNVLSYDYYVCGLNIGGEEYTVKAVVSNISDGSRYYDHKLTNIEKGRLIDMINKAPESSVSISTQTPESSAFSKSKDKRLELILQTNSSKIVDANGEPKVAEHSTWNEDFYTFDINHLGESSGDEGVYGAGFYFGNVGETELYGDRAIQAYLNLHNPLVLPDAPIKGFFDYLVENFDKEGLRDIVVKQGNNTATMGDVVDAIKSVNEAHARGEYAELIEQMSQYWMGAEGRVLEQQIFRKIGFAIYPTLEPFIQYNVGRKEFSEALRNAGYDGVVYDNQEYIAFEPNQIKSADVVTYDDAGNIIPLSERFNPEKEDIRYSLREATGEEVKEYLADALRAAYADRLEQIDKRYDYIADTAKKGRRPFIFGDMDAALALAAPDVKGGLSLELQIAYDIANGLKFRWADSEGGIYKGLQQAIGDRKSVAGILDAQEGAYLNDYATRLAEQVGMSAEDVQEAVVNVVRNNPSRKAAIKTLGKDIPFEYNERVEQAIEDSRARAKGKVSAEFEAALNSPNGNTPYARLMQDEAVEIVRASEVLRDMRAEIRGLRKKHAESKYEQAVRIETMRKRITDMVGTYFGRNMNAAEIKTLVNLISKAHTPEALERALDMIQRQEFNVQYRMQRQRKGRLLQNRISFAFTGNEMSVEQYLRQEGVDDATIKRLLSNRFKGVDAKGISVAKFVSAEVAKLMELVNNNINLTKSIEEQYSDFVNELNEAMQKVPTALLNNETLRSAIETLPTIMRMYWQVDEMVNSAKTYESDLKRLNDKIKEAEEAITFRPQDMSDEAYEERTDQFSQVLKELIQLRDALMRQHLADMPAIVKLMTEANNAIEQMLLGGKQLLSEERKALERHKREVLQDAEMDITNYGQDYDALRADATRHKTSKERAKKEEKKRGLLSGIMSETFDSLDQMLRKMGSDSASGMGRTHQRIMGGLIQATNLMRDNINDVDDAINRKLRQLWGGRKGYRSLEDIIYQSQKIVVGSWNYARVANEARVVIEAGKPRTVYEEQTRTFNTELTLGQALYVLSAWNQADGRLKLEHNGFTQDDINSIMRAIADVDARWLDLMDFVIDELLPSRRDYYDEVHRRVNGAYMARVENYFPLKISSEEVYKEADLDAMSITEATIIPSAIINRTHNTKMIDLDVDFFKVLLENVTDMERWAAMVEIRQDMTTILSDTRTRNMMEQKYGVNFVADLERAMKVAVGTYTCKIPTTAEKALLYITRRWAGSRIAGRISTALKQLVGIGAYITYATSWAYWLKVFKVMRHPVQNIKEALEMFPMLQQRWKSASSGDVLLQQFNHTVNVKTEGKLEWKQFDAWLDKVTRLGIMPNAAVDLFVSAVMAKATYEWEMERYLNQGFSREIAEQKAKIDAELSYNLTQQSAETMFIGSLQASPSLVSRAATTFMNNPIANIRLGMQGFADIQRALKWQRVLHNERNRLAIEYRKQFIAEGMDEEQAGILAEQKALREVQKTKKGGVVWRGIKKMLWGYFLNATTFTLAGGIWLLCKYWDDDEKLDEMGLTGMDLLWTTVASPFQAIPVAKQLTDLLIYGKTSFIPMLDDALREFEGLRQYIENDNVSPSAVYAFSNAVLSLGVGVDMNTWINMADGVVDMFNGDWDAGVAKLINKPKSQIKLLIGDRKEGETAKEYMTRVMRTMSIVDKNKIDVAELENYNFELGKWEKPTNISAAEKRKVSEIDNQYQAEYKKDMLKRCSEEVHTNYAEVVEKHVEILKDMGVKDTKLALVRYYEQMVDTLTPEVASALERLAVLQAEISVTERNLDLLVSQDGKEYIDLLTEEFNLRKEFVAQYEIYKNLTE